MSIHRRFLSAAFVAMAALALTMPLAAAPSRSFEVVDAREGSTRGDARNVSGGAEVTIGDRTLGTSLVDRLADRLDRGHGAAMAGQRLTVTQARLTLFIQDGFATPAQASLDPAIRRLGDLNQTDELSQITVRSTRGLRRYTATIAGEVGGRPFSTEQVVEFRTQSADARSRDRAINAALDDAVAQITGATR
jgi:hypothetical protein